MTNARDGTRATSADSPALEPAHIPETITFGPSPTGRGVRLEAVQWLPQAPDQMFEFFSDAFRLEALTPSFLHFHVSTPRPIVIAAGTEIDYRLRLHGIPLRWRSRISVWEPPVRFVDEQVRGPYRYWHHEHLFEPADEGTRCRDIVDYAPPGGLLVDAMFVRRSLRRIFAYRQAKLRELFASA